MLIAPHDGEEVMEEVEEVIPGSSDGFHLKTTLKDMRAHHRTAPQIMRATIQANISSAMDGDLSHDQGSESLDLSRSAFNLDRSLIAVFPSKKKRRYFRVLLFQANSALLFCKLNRCGV